MSTIYTKTVTISPAKAKEMLDRSTRNGAVNRKLSQRYVEIYANEMKNGNWKFNGESIKVDVNGNILDGQHRLQACIRANTAFKTLLITGVETESFDTIDCGRLRTGAQVLQMSSVKYNSLISAIITGVRDFRDSGHSKHHEHRLTPSAILAEYNANSEAYDEAARVAARVTNEAHAMTAKLVGTLYYHLVYDLKQRAELVDRFMAEINSFDSSENAAVDKLRKWNLANRGMKMSDRIRCGYIVLTWNAMLKGAKAPRFSEKAIEEMPSFVVEAK